MEAEAAKEAEAAEEAGYEPPDEKRWEAWAEVTIAELVEATQEQVLKEMNDNPWNGMV